MLINNSNNINHVEFVSYKSSDYALCLGVLTLKIDGEIVAFGKNGNRFWISGGGITSDYNTYNGEWVIDVNKIPEQYRKYATEIDAVINENVEHGCCGGCI